MAYPGPDQAKWARLWKASGFSRSAGSDHPPHIPVQTIPSPTSDPAQPRVSSQPPNRDTTGTSSAVAPVSTPTRRSPRRSQPSRTPARACAAPIPALTTALRKTRVNSAIPAIAGRDKAYLEETLKAYKAGTKQATIMNQLAKGYTDEEIAVLADYFSRQK